MEKYLATPAATVTLRRRKAKPFFMQHPWVFSGAIYKIEGEPGGGDLVTVKDEHGNFVGRGLYDGDSQIAVRLVSWDAEEIIDRAWARRRVAEAVALRTETLALPERTDAWRAVHAEGDRLPGVIVDHFAGHLVMSITDVGMARRREWLLAALAEALSPSSVYERDVTISDTGRRAMEARGDVGDAPTPERIRIHENGIPFDVDARGGQKTGWFCDQRDNRLAIARYAGGRTVLDLYSYSGGFAIACIVHGNASRAVAVDSSAPACELARSNVELNGVADRVTVHKDDAFVHLDRCAENGATFDMVILDPPKLAFREAHRRKALSVYREINRRALRVVSPGGILVSCSCSGVVSAGDLLRAVTEAAHEARRTLRLIEERSQPADHPVSPACPETRYLKCLVFSVV